MSGSFSSLARSPLGGIPFAVRKPSLADEPLENVGRRAAPRLRLSIPARLITVAETRRCILLDLSRSGAQIGLELPLQIGDVGFLQFAEMEVFAAVIRTGPGLNGVEFDIPLEDSEVLAVRHFAEAFEADERRALRSEARNWVLGGK